MNKRAIAILGAIFILIVGTLGFLIYQRSQNNTEVADQTQPTNEQPEPLPPVEEEEPPTDELPPENADPGLRAIKLTSNEVVSPVLFYQGNGITYFNSQGQLFQTELEITASNVLLGDEQELTIALTPGITKILWPQSGNNFIAEIGTGTNRTWSFYDSAKGLYVTLPSQVKSVDWLPSSDKILLTYVDSAGKATLNSTNPDGTGYETLIEMYGVDDQISVAPDGKNLLFWRTQNREATNIINLLATDGTGYKAIVTDGYNLGVKWSPDSQKFVFGRRDPQTQVYGLWMADLASGQVKNLGVNTIPDKVVWNKSSTFVYAAVPKKGNAGNGLTEDTIYRINVAGNSKQEYAPGTVIDARELFLDSSENNLFFKNAQDGALYYLSVSP